MMQKQIFVIPGCHEEANPESSSKTHLEIPGRRRAVPE
jgi:hypothetical protein